MSESFIKYDNEKPRTDLLPPLALLRVASVLGFGAKKYSEDNWKKCEKNNRYIAAAMRHLLEYNAGKRIDEESGEPTLSHAVASLLFALELDLIKEEK